ncbi:SNF2-related protein [Sharpea azabuensis]|uniref:SNF2-related protein n=1 Tax=Sharpea azabuensis TaxID=322505 RepID=UPI003D06853A
MGKANLAEAMFVRCAADIEDMENPRIFVCGKIKSIDVLSKTADIEVSDPLNIKKYFNDLPKGLIKRSFDQITRCTLFINSTVEHLGKKAKVIAKEKNKNDRYYYYYLQYEDTKEIARVCETQIIASFNNGKIQPITQLKNYEFQHPVWYLGRSVVSKNMNILNNSIYGFKELAGCKIFLMPHQINTIMRCLDSLPCRYMLADEVGMGKTIEAISVLSIFIKDRINQKVLIAVPNTLVEQWRTELLFKFGLYVGENDNGNNIELVPVEEISLYSHKNWDFVIVDEIHKYINKDRYYKNLEMISINTGNILLLSATPVQDRKSEYLRLLQVLEPNKYAQYTLSQFTSLIDLQKSIIMDTSLILDDLEDYQDILEETIQNEESIEESEDCQEIFSDIKDGLEEIIDKINDVKLKDLFERVDFYSKDFGVGAIKIIISYICSNYQIENSVIRNRRKILMISNDQQEMATRELIELGYGFDYTNRFEYDVYHDLESYIESIDQIDEYIIENNIKPLLSSFFSSPWAFESQIKISNIKIDKRNLDAWLKYEDYIVDHVVDIINNPDSYEEYYNTRLVKVVDFITQEIVNSKVVIFTNFEETFNMYKKALENLFEADAIAFFGKTINKLDAEMNVYKFQNNEDCFVLLCDESGGEGRNFQNADYLIHVDLPWDASQIEQRIGRLDRLGRNQEHNKVFSVVPYLQDTFEEALFKFWKEGLKIFNMSLSGMEIIMGDINREIYESIMIDFKNELFNRIPNIIKLMDNSRNIIKKEQDFDAAAEMYKPMYNRLSRLVEYYNEHENELFAHSMLNWASLAGFNAQIDKSQNVIFSSSSFSPHSAMKSQLIPPNWNVYLKKRKIAYMNRVIKDYDETKKLNFQDRSIRGTFIREKAINNDYLHFFAPGDELFDSIVNNALQSCKGTASAFAVKSNYNWKGFIFTWKLEPNIEYLLNKGISIYSLAKYRGYINSQLYITPYMIDTDSDYSDELIRREYSKIINSGYKNKQKLVNFGSRENKLKWLNSELLQYNENDITSNISYFKEIYPEEDWSDIVSEARSKCFADAAAYYKKRSRTSEAVNEMEREYSAKVANAQLYGMAEDDLIEFKEKQEILLEALKHSKIVLDSAVFVWMVKDEQK